MLREAKNRLKSATPGDPLVAKAEDLLSISDELIASLTDYETDPGAYADYRRQVALTLVEILKKAPVPTPTSTALPTPMATGTQTPVITPTVTPSLVTVTPFITPTSTPFFIDVPEHYWAYAYIKNLYDNGYVKGCSTEPLQYCPKDGMKRDEASVFVVRGVEGAEYIPPEPTEQVFADVYLGVWHTKWITKLEEGGYTDGCGVNDLGERNFCPYEKHTRAEATVFFLRMLYGPDYLPPLPNVDRAFTYDDVPVIGDLWYPKWVYAAYDAGFVEGCEDEANQGDNLFRPEEMITRAEAACMLARAVGLN
ncbi:MAG: hypothetical protein A2Z14_02530 [Chloroflexi bacterium RBG_16_48_8]|nr:MAG: hypothetical protein A2Z14_02530 [Chloroflexi bacterium RBG_16_48_8]